MYTSCNLDSNSIQETKIAAAGCRAINRSILLSRVSVSTSTLLLSCRDSDFSILLSTLLSTLSIS